MKQKQTRILIAIYEIGADTPDGHFDVLTSGYDTVVKLADELVSESGNGMIGLLHMTITQPKPGAGLFPKVEIQDVTKSFAQVVAGILAGRIHDLGKRKYRGEEIAPVEIPNSLPVIVEELTNMSQGWLEEKRAELLRTPDDDVIAELERRSDIARGH